MRRITLVLGLLALLAVSACGSSGDDGGESEARTDPRVVAAIEASLSRDIETRLRRQIGDTALRVTSLRCAGATVNTVQCVARATDSRGARGNIALAVVVDDTRGTAMAQFTGTSRRAWATALNRGAAARQQNAQQR